MKYRVAAVVLMVTVAASASPSGQSLAEVARQEEARRKAIKTPAKVYTNDSIRSGSTPLAPPPSVPAPAAAAAGGSVAAPAAVTSSSSKAASASSPSPAAGPADDTSGEKKDEQYWRKRIQGERDALARSQIFAESLQTRINVLSADFVGRDDPAQRAVIANDRQKALAELERVKQEIVAHTKSIAGVQDEARRAGVPPGWLR
jgi:hypothetical protein